MKSSHGEFDRRVDRRGIANLNKWNWYPEDVLPLWVADMDFAAPEPILAALHAALDHGVLGYELASSSLLEVVAERLHRLYGWDVSPEAIVAVPNVAVGYRVAASAACAPGEGVLVQPPVFHDFVDFPEAYGLTRQEAPLRRVDDGRIIRYELDLDALAGEVHSRDAKTGMFLLCNPHNPVGRVFSAEELAALAGICEANDVLLCSDDVHNELLLGGASYTPVAVLSAWAQERTISLLSPSKGFNVSGLGCAFAVVPDAPRREIYAAELHRLAVVPSSLGLVAARAAYGGECDDWLAALCAYLTDNRDLLVGFVQAELPGVRTTVPDATYLTWLDCGDLVESGVIAGCSPQAFFLERARVALMDGAAFGRGGESFVRLNFACPRSVLEEALERMKRALG